MSFDFRTQANDNVFPVDLTISGKDVHVDILSPTVQMVRDMVNLMNGLQDLDAVSDMVGKILNNNKQGIRISAEAVSTLTIDSLYAFVREYSRWIGVERKTKN
ncbi:MAG: hypothetical protein J6N19_16750 [Clostridium sp.]|nr:hypothetical protein [Clostridium sp.]